MYGGIVASGQPGVPGGAEGHASVSGALAGWAERTPDAVAFRFLPAGGEPKALSFAGLNRQVDIIASALASRQEPGSRALLVFKPGLDFIAAFVACLRAGVVAVPLRPPGPRETGGRIAAVIADAGADLILTHGEAASLPAGHALDCPILEVDGLRAPDAPAAGPARHSELALLQYTSGTTGTPKGVMVRHANLMSNIAIMMQRLGVGPGSATVSWLPHYHDMGLVGPILVALVSGNSANLIAPADFLRAPLSWLEAISRYRADMAIGPNFGYELCAAKLLDGGEALDALGIDLSCLRVAVVGAEPVRAATLARFLSAAAPLGFPSQAFFPSYGLAECTLFVDGIQGTLAGTVRRFDAQALKEGKAASGKERVLVACGMRDGESETSVVIADPDVETVLPDGSIGEVCVSGPGVAAGYWGREAETAAVFDRPIAGAPGHYMRTGDLGFYHEGKLFITGRRDDLIILNGVNHHPQDLEATAASTHPALSAWRAAVIAVEDAGHYRVIALIEIPREVRFSLDPEKLIASIREAVFDGHELPLHDVVLLSPGRLPVTSSGKVRRRACRELFQSGEIESLRWRAAGRKREQGQRAAETATAAPTGAASSPATPLDTLREIIAEVSGHPVAEVDASLRMSAQPVDSLKLIQIQLLLESRLGLRLTVESMLAANSLAALAAGLDPFRLPLAAELHADSSLPAEYVPPSEAWEPGGDLLVTGATGMLGAHIVRELIARTSARIHCLLAGDRRSPREGSSGI